MLQYYISPESYHICGSYLSAYHLGWEEEDEIGKVNDWKNPERNQLDVLFKSAESEKTYYVGRWGLGEECSDMYFPLVFSLFCQNL